jgi:hypothetical protein
MAFPGLRPDYCIRKGRAIEDIDRKWNAGLASHLLVLQQCSSFGFVIRPCHAVNAYLMPDVYTMGPTEIGSVRSARFLDIVDPESLSFSQ